MWKMIANRRHSQPGTKQKSDRNHMFLRLFYKAKATHPPFTFHDLEIMREGIANNTVNAVTSLLLRSDREYFQVIEGAEQSVRDLVSRIQRDPRLFAFELISSDMVPQRMFDASPLEFHMLEYNERDLVKRLTMLAPTSNPAFKTSVLRDLAAISLHRAASAA